MFVLFCSVDTGALLLDLGGKIGPVHRNQSPAAFPIVPWPSNPVVVPGEKVSWFLRITQSITVGAPQYRQS